MIVTASIQVEGWRTRRLVVNRERGGDDSVLRCCNPIGKRKVKSDDGKHEWDESVYNVLLSLEWQRRGNATHLVATCGCGVRTLIPVYKVMKTIEQESDPHSLKGERENDD